MRVPTCAPTRQTTCMTTAASKTNAKLQISRRKFDARNPLRYHSVAGWSSLVARWAHNPKVEGSNPSPATKHISGPDTHKDAQLPQCQSAMTNKATVLVAYLSDKALTREAAVYDYPRGRQELLPPRALEPPDAGDRRICISFPGVSNLMVPEDASARPEHEVATEQKLQDAR